jgi:hypothetical protein
MPSSANIPRLATVPSRANGVIPAKHHTPIEAPGRGCASADSSTIGPSEIPIMRPRRWVPTRPSTHTRPPPRAVHRLAPRFAPRSPSDARSRTTTTAASPPNVESQRASTRLAAPTGPSQRYVPSRSQVGWNVAGGPLTGALRGGSTAVLVTGSAAATRMTAMRHAMVREVHARTADPLRPGPAWGQIPQWMSFTAALETHILLNSRSTRRGGGLVVCF